MQKELLQTAQPPVRRKSLQFCNACGMLTRRLRDPRDAQGMTRQKGMSRPETMTRPKELPSKRNWSKPAQNRSEPCGKQRKEMEAGGRMGRKRGQEILARVEKVTHWKGWNHRNGTLFLPSPLPFSSLPPLPSKSGSKWQPSKKMQNRQLSKCFKVTTEKKKNVKRSMWKCVSQQSLSKCFTVTSQAVAVCPPPRLPSHYALNHGRCVTSCKASSGK